MENNMQRNHVLSEYAVRIKKDRTEPETLVNGPTVLTEALENSDIDEFTAKGITVETRNIEISDPDELYMEPTKHTFTVEVSDEDEFLM